MSVPTAQQTLADFLLARIAEDEAAARHAPGSGRDWQALEGRDEWAVVENATSLVAAQSRDPWWARHIARHDPARVLAECDAKRRIVQDMPFVGECAAELLLRVGQILALPYAAHPDYREEWRP
jgi:hypothetical protein